MLQRDLRDSMRRHRDEIMRGIGLTRQEGTDSVVISKRNTGNATGWQRKSLDVTIDYLPAMGRRYHGRKIWV